LKPVWEDLGVAYADEPSIVIAKIDATANDYPGDRVTMYPTLQLFKADDKKPIPYMSNIIIFI
jgi:hypothetical protein